MPAALLKAAQIRAVLALCLALCLGCADGQRAEYTKPDSHAPLAPHQLVVVPPGGDALITLSGYDLDGDMLRATVTQLPSSRAGLYQLSKVFSDYGYEPKKGAAVTQTGAVVTGSENRLYYKRPAGDSAPVGAYDVLEYTVTDLTPLGKEKSTSQAGKVTVVPPSGVLVGSHFTRGDEGWKIIGNKAASHPVTHEPSSRGVRLNHYVYGSDDTIDTQSRSAREGQTSTQTDKQLWYFEAPEKFTGHHGIAYGGTLEFTMASFQGDFSSPDMFNLGREGRSGATLVEIHCATCNVNRGVTVAFPLSAAREYRQGGTQGGTDVAFTGETTSFALPLKEDEGWLQDPKNTLVEWQPPTQCQFIELLSGISSLRILGDFTTWYESVALDTVELRNTVAQLPICAQQRPDASLCTCAGVNWKDRVNAFSYHERS